MAIRAVFYGASSVEGAGASTPERRFSSVVCRALGWEEINLGIGGTCATGRDADGMVVDEDSGLGRVPFVLEARPDLVLILYGANDFGQSKPLGAADRFQQGTYFWDFDTMLRGLLAELQPEQIVLSTAQYRAGALTPNAQGLTLEDYNSVVRQMAARYKLRMLDPYANAGIDARNFGSLSADDAHLNDAGYERLAGFYIEAVRDWDKIA